MTVPPSTEPSDEGRQLLMIISPSASEPQDAAHIWVVYTTGSFPSSFPASTTRLLASRFMKAAICSRVTLSLGQNWVLSGGLQPRVTSASASQAMSSWKMLESGTSSKSSAAITTNGVTISSAIATRKAVKRREWAGIVVSFLVPCLCRSRVGEPSRELIDEKDSTQSEPSTTAVIQRDACPRLALALGG